MQFLSYEILKNLFTLMLHIMIYCHIFNKISVTFILSYKSIYLFFKFKLIHFAFFPLVYNLCDNIAFFFEHYECKVHSGGLPET